MVYKEECIFTLVKIEAIQGLARPTFIIEIRSYIELAR